MRTIIAGVLGASLLLGGTAATASATGTATGTDRVCTYLRPGEAPGPLRHGSTGRVVKQLQCLLNLAVVELGLEDADGKPLAPLALDGSFGAATQHRIVLVQRALLLPADGPVGPRLWAILESYDTSR
ncbi:peptidoglycan-binding domain-containing protein [Arsenicicoccus dermatophilus]|uniref:peptidoglycan-binding domain-containing protein n=1 Tax=Arsenicicoccus dermatophilus TaxID=1076331 RepID=UPI001F4D1A7B|nr:hypothetical protein [Arsenicicoccus dermatophilus]MCH8611560.1 hypothetical protein [Arsenicicoccus dermatophilus]